ncbi:MAG: hypothetical protein WC343_01570 [Bacilli bacterium]|jgi:hypothetical protein
MNASIILLIASIVAGIGGWMITLPNWTAATTPVSMGGLCLIVGSVVCAWLGKSPLRGIVAPPEPPK